MSKAKLQEQSELLMPKATAVWLIDNTALTFEQIGDFTGLTDLEVQAIADGDVGRGIQGRNPVRHNEVTQEELDKAEKDPAYRMTKQKSDLPPVKVRSKGPKYTPVSKRRDKPDAVMYLLKHHPELSDAQICKLIGTTKPTVNSVRERTHANSANIRPQNPVDLGLCTYAELNEVSRKALRAQGKDPDEVQRQKEEEARQEAARQQDEEDHGAAGALAGFDFSNFLNVGGDDSASDEE